ncbi:hypothetical protein [Longitalea luteola]|nr:hypothetical protein [Longitalea luteola]
MRASEKTNSVGKNKQGAGVRTTVALAKGGVAGGSLVDMDCIASLPVS